MSFTDKLYLETKDAHTIVDKHPFVSMIRTNKLAGKMYINFNKICIREIQGQSFKLKNQELYKKLHRNIDLEIDIDVTNILSELLKHCRNFPLESAYQFYLGLLFGGNMLKKMLPEYHDFLTYKDNKSLISEFKMYICDNINDQDQDIFIQNVNNSYKLIKKLFDEFYNKLNEKI